MPETADILDRLRRSLPALWLGGLLCVAGIATPAAFALLARAEAGPVVARILGQEAWLSLGIAVLLLLLERCLGVLLGGRCLSRVYRLLNCLLIAKHIRKKGHLHFP
mgnify:CR=1 FL=1